MKKLDITPATEAGIDPDIAQEFIEHRLNLKKPLTQGAFNRAVKAATRCERDLPITASEAIEITIDKGWQGVVVEYIANTLANQNRAAIEAVSTMAITHRGGPRLVSDNPL